MDASNQNINIAIEQVNNILNRYGYDCRVLVMDFTHFTEVDENDLGLNDISFLIICQENSK